MQYGVKISNRYVPLIMPRVPTCHALLSTRARPFPLFLSAFFFHRAPRPRESNLLVGIVFRTCGIRKCKQKWSTTSFSNLLALLTIVCAQWRSTTTIRLALWRQTRLYWYLTSYFVPLLGLTLPVVASFFNVFRVLYLQGYYLRSWYPSCKEKGGCI